MSRLQYHRGIRLLMKNKSKEIDPSGTICTKLCCKIYIRENSRTSAATAESGVFGMESSGQLGARMGYCHPNTATSAVTDELLSRHCLVLFCWMAFSVINLYFRWGWKQQTIALPNFEHSELELLPFTQRPAPRLQTLGLWFDKNPQFCTFLSINT